LCEKQPMTTKRNKENRDNRQSKHDAKDAVVIADMNSEALLLKILAQTGKRSHIALHSSITVSKHHFYAK